jgi:hypothetical protein
MRKTMSRFPALRRRRDGLHEIVPTNPIPDRAERHAALFGVLLVAMGLFVSGLIPPELLALVAGCGAATEAAIALATSGFGLAPKAEVHLLAPVPPHAARDRR